MRPASLPEWVENVGGADAYTRTAEIIRVLSDVVYAIKRHHTARDAQITVSTIQEEINPD